jgi:hypothetical protein
MARLTDGLLAVAARTDESPDEADTRLANRMRALTAELAALVHQTQDPESAAADALRSLRRRLVWSFEVLRGNRRTPNLPDFATPNVTSRHPT